MTAALLAKRIHLIKVKYHIIEAARERKITVQHHLWAHGGPWNECSGDGARGSYAGVSKVQSKGNLEKEVLMLLGLG
jgi:hypothetical protein